ncbi:MAG: hypothetical protein Q9208_008132 [Pyrenodesmia sp. 3 TL-2023]
MFIAAKFTALTIVLALQSNYAGQNPFVIAVLNILHSAPQEASTYPNPLPRLLYCAASPHQSLQRSISLQIPPTEIPIATVPTRQLHPSSTPLNSPIHTRTEMRLLTLLIVVLLVFIAIVTSISFLAVLGLFPLLLTAIVGLGPILLASSVFILGFAAVFYCSGLADMMVNTLRVAAVVVVVLAMMGVVVLVWKIVKGVVVLSRKIGRGVVVLSRKIVRGVGRMLFGREVKLPGQGDDGNGKVVGS